MNEVIEQLKKVCLGLAVRGAGDQGCGEGRLEFFHGLAADGLSPFEMALSGRGVGERLTCELSPAMLREYFGAQLPALHVALAGGLPDGPFTLEVAVLAVTAGADHELVRAMARSGHGCGSSCGCGCSG